MRKLFVSALMVLTLSIGGISVFATQLETSSSINVNENVVIDGEVGDVIEVGDCIFEIVDDFTINNQTRASQKGFSITLSGTEYSQSFSVTDDMPYAKVYIDNSQGPADIIFTITKGSPTGTVVSGSDVTVKKGKKVTVRSTNAWPASTYYANFTSPNASMSASASSRIASTLSELG